ncbi:ABC transporter ATP-binding protein [Saccharopolyspora phatthalungensis]|uniref:ABC-2 type transport system ATP-binding protein n=1 Tax=Saccharopolyspora phatthalungensis TaxID=664693 RepID=A0A840QD83_9PSEU|nr:ABC transporter ATP-binding protein [Saccharopolyspora phatthalungensis]MBB5158724.1 ABC-2 type transport system ATP-binding protein [Saccharopolyspora phatthalungensis]
MSAWALRCRKLVKRYGAVTALDGLDLDVRQGECFGLLGPNGAGKTTTMEIVAGLLDPGAGDIEVLGGNWRADKELRTRVGIALQETHLPDHLTVRELLALFRSFYRDGPTVSSLIEQLGLADKRDTLFLNLSGGQKQRVAVGCALVGDPELVLLDEPTAGLDPQARRRIWDVLGKLRTEGRTVLLSTHHIDEAERVCDRVAVVDHGRVIAVGAPGELIARLDSTSLVEFRVEGVADIAELPGVRCAERLDADRFRLAGSELHPMVEALFARASTAGFRVVDLTTRQATLEDVFVKLTGRHLRD